jgi:hypothetical protein
MTPETDNSYNNEDIYDRTLGIDASKLTITRTAVPKILKPAEELIFGTSFTGEHFIDDIPAAS